MRSKGAVRGRASKRMRSGATKSVAGSNTPRPIAVDWASRPLRVKSGEDLGRRVLNSSEGR